MLGFFEIKFTAYDLPLVQEAAVQTEAVQAGAHVAALQASSVECVGRDVVEIEELTGCLVLQQQPRCQPGAGDEAGGCACQVIVASEHMTMK